MYNEYLVTLHKIIIKVLDNKHTNSNSNSNRLIKIITIRNIRLSNYSNNKNRITKYYALLYLYLLIIIYNVVKYLYEIVNLYINYFI